MMADTYTVTLSLVRICSTLELRHRTLARTRAYLLRRYVEDLDPHVDDLHDVHAGDDEEDPWPPRAAGEQQPQPEHDGSLVLLDTGLGVAPWH